MATQQKKTNKNKGGAHAELKKGLQGPYGKKIVCDITRNIYDWAYKIPDEYIQYRMFEEFTIRIDTDEMTRLGLPKKELRRLDAVLFVEPGFRALNQGQTYTIGVEIKGSVPDMRADDKLELYIGWCDYFFIAFDGRVPLLKEEALSRADSDNRIGVIDIVNRFVLKMPEQVHVPIERQLLVLQNAMYAYMFKENNKILKFADLEEPNGYSHNESKLTSVPADSNEYPHDYSHYDSKPLAKDYSHNESKNATTPDSSNKGDESLPKEQPMHKDKIPEERTWRKEDADKIKTKYNQSVQAALSLVDPTAIAVYDVLAQAPDVDRTTKRAALAIGISESACANALSALKKFGLINRLGSCKKGTYEIVSNPVIPEKSLKVPASAKVVDVKVAPGQNVSKNTVAIVYTETPNASNDNDK